MSSFPNFSRTLPSIHVYLQMDGAKKNERLILPCGDMSHASFGTLLVEGTVGAAVFTVEVSLCGEQWWSHPDNPSIILGQVSRPIDVSAYGFVSLVVSTINAAALRVDAHGFSKRLI